MSQPVRLWVKSLALPLAIAASHASLAAAPGGTAYVPPPLSIYGQLPSLADPAVSPAGDRLACIERRHGKRYIVVFDLTKGKPAAAALVGQTKIRALRWYDDHRLLILYSATSYPPFGVSGCPISLPSCAGPAIACPRLTINSHGTGTAFSA